MKKVLLSLLTILAFANYSCKKIKDPSAELLIVDTNNAPMVGATVNINSRSVVNGIVDTVMKTGSDGKIFYTRKFEAILEAKASKGKLFGVEYFQLKTNELTEKTIIIK
jgi:hypothetical protein